MKTNTLLRLLIIFPMIFLALAAFPFPTSASHSWNGYHWARTRNPFTLKLGDNMSSTWDPHLRTASTDWTRSTVLDTTIVTGQANPQNCRPTRGRVEVCNSRYGNNGWLGVAQIWVSGKHIVQGVAKMNDTYFNTSRYNTSAWRRLVVCQEVAHTFGLDHQDENFNNPNLGTCMDYTNDPDGPPSNDHPNSHDYQQLETIYAHLDSTSTVGAMPADMAKGDLNTPAQWGKLVKSSSDGRLATYVRDFGQGHKVVTFVFWVEDASR